MSASPDAVDLRQETAGAFNQAIASRGVKRGTHRSLAATTCTWNRQESKQRGESHGRFVGSRERNRRRLELVNGESLFQVTDATMERHGLIGLLDRFKIPGLVLQRLHQR